MYVYIHQHIYLLYWNEKYCKVSSTSLKLDPQIGNILCISNIFIYMQHSRLLYKQTEMAIWIGATEQAIVVPRESETLNGVNERRRRWQSEMKSNWQVCFALLLLICRWSVSAAVAIIEMRYLRASYHQKMQMKRVFFSRYFFVVFYF